MMYSNKMALAVKSQGRVLRESRDGDNTTVFMPFGCEYSLMLKNLDSSKALAKVWIDGVDVTHGTSGLIVNPNDTFDLERYIKDGNMAAGNRFKFIERTAGVSAHRGNKIDDGLIRVEFEFEYRAPQPFNYLSYPVRGVNGGMLYSKGLGDLQGAAGAAADGAMYASAAVHDGNASTDWTITTSTASLNMVDDTPRMKGKLQASSASLARSIPQNDVGVTVAGSVSEQQFSHGAWFQTDGVKHVMVLQMLGEVQGEPVIKPVTVEMKPTCTSCGKVNKATAKFCSECGTGLQLVTRTYGHPPRNTVQR